MAIKFPDFLKASDAKTRIFLVLTGIVAIGLIIFAAVRFFGGREGATGPSKVAGAPIGPSVPGGTLSPAYERAVIQANAQAAEKAKMTGGTSVPTLINPGQQNNCTVLCPGEEAANVADNINESLRAGKLLQDEADKLLALAKNNAVPGDFAAALDELVRQGKLTPEQARQLLDKYRLQHQNALLAESAKAMDPLIKSGELPLSVANDLLALQKKNVSLCEYAAELDRIVREGKITPGLSSRLLAQYAQQHAREAVNEGQAQLRRMAATGQIPADVADDLIGYQKRNAPASEYNAELDRLVAAGKLIPALVVRLRDQYKQQKTGLLQLVL